MLQAYALEGRSNGVPEMLDRSSPLGAEVEQDLWKY